MSLLKRGISATFFKYLSGGLGVLLVISLMLLGAANRSSAKKSLQITALTAQKEKLEADLARISSEKDTQTTVTVRTVERVVKGDPQIKIITKTIKEAPLPADCATPAIEIAREAS